MIRAAIMRQPEQPLAVETFAEPELEPGAILLETIPHHPWPRQRGTYRPAGWT